MVLDGLGWPYSFSGEEPRKKQVYICSITLVHIVAFLDGAYRFKRAGSHELGYRKGRN